MEGYEMKAINGNVQLVLKKKYGVVMVSLMLCLSIFLSACGSKSNNTSDTTGDAATNTVKSAVDPYKLVMYYPGSSPKDLKLVQDEMSKYLTEKINATIELKPIDWGAWGDKKSLMFAANENFDIIFTAAWDGYASTVSKGQFVELDGLLDKYGQSAKETLGADWLNGSKINGHNYALPTLKEFASTAGIVARKDLLKKYNIDLNAIKTVADLDPVFKTIKENEPGVTPILASDGQGLAGQMMSAEFDILGDTWGVLDRDSNEMKVVNQVESAKFKEMIALMRKWNLAGYINKDAASIKEDQLNNMMKAGKGFSYGLQLKPGKDAEVSIQLGLELQQKEFAKPLTTTNEASGAMLAISRTSKNPERAMLFLNLLYTDKYLINLLNFGIEGKHFVKKSDNVIDFADGLTSQTSGYNIGSAWMFGNQMNTFLWPNEDAAKWEKFAQFNESSQKSPALGFIWDPTNVKNEIASCENIRKEFGAALGSGAIDPENYLPKYIEKLKKAGIDLIIAEKQKQLDEWVKNKS
jgi:putative aldouronate transport system substrate-binding protein